MRRTHASACVRGRTSACGLAGLLRVLAALCMLNLQQGELPTEGVSCTVQCKEKACCVRLRHAGCPLSAWHPFWEQAHACAAQASHTLGRCRRIVHAATQGSLLPGPVTPSVAATAPAGARAGFCPHAKQQEYARPRTHALQEMAFDSKFEAVFQSLHTPHLRPVATSFVRAAWRAVVSASPAHKSTKE